MRNAAQHACGAATGAPRTPRTVGAKEPRVARAGVVLTTGAVPAALVWAFCSDAKGQQEQDGGARGGACGASLVRPRGGHREKDVGRASQPRGPEMHSRTQEHTGFDSSDFHFVRGTPSKSRDCARARNATIAVGCPRCRLVFSHVHVVNTPVLGTM